MNQLSTTKFVSILLTSAFCFAFGFSGFLFVNREKPILYRSGNLVFIQNPFRDKHREAVADRFLVANVGQTVGDMASENPEIGFKKREGEEQYGKLVKWSLEDRHDSENETTFFYFVYREDVEHKPKRGKHLLSFVSLRVERKDGEFRVTEYDCTGVSWNDW